MSSRKAQNLVIILESTQESLRTSVFVLSTTFSHPLIVRKIARIRGTLSPSYFLAASFFPSDSWWISARKKNNNSLPFSYQKTWSGTTNIINLTFHHLRRAQTMKVHRNDTTICARSSSPQVVSYYKLFQRQRKIQTASKNLINRKNLKKMHL